MRTKYLDVKTGKKIGISRFPNFSGTSNITLMKRNFYGKDALLVRCGQYIYNVTSEPEIYTLAH